VLLSVGGIILVGSAAIEAFVTKIGLFCSYSSAGVALESTKFNGGMEGGMVRAAIELHSVKASYSVIVAKLG
jgi:hypothetical protein